METEIIDINGIIILIHNCLNEEQQLLLEAKDYGTHLTGQYSYDKHTRHNPTGENHLHVYKKGNEILAINQSGKGHDGYSGTRIPNEVFTSLKSKFPNWIWPSNQIIESLNSTYIFNNMRYGLRKVKVFPYNFEVSNHDGFDGYFHTFVDDPFLTGGNGGWKERTVAIIETEDGYMRKVPVDRFMFTDIETN